MNKCRKCEKCEKEINFKELINSYAKYICPTCFQKDFTPPYFKASDGTDINIGDELFFVDVAKDGNVKVDSSISIGYSNGYTDPPEVSEFPQYIYDGAGTYIVLENGRSIHSGHLSSSFETAVKFNSAQCKENIKIGRSLIVRKKRAYSKKIKTLRESHKKSTSVLLAKKERWTKALSNTKKLM